MIQAEAEVPPEPPVEALQQHVPLPAVGQAQWKQVQHLQRQSTESREELARQGDQMESLMGTMRANTSSLHKTQASLANLEKSISNIKEGLHDVVGTLRALTERPAPTAPVAGGRDAAATAKHTAELERAAELAHIVATQTANKSTAAWADDITSDDEPAPRVGYASLRDEKQHVHAAVRMAPAAPPPYLVRTPEELAQQATDLHAWVAAAPRLPLPVLTNFKNEQLYMAAVQDCVANNLDRFNSAKETFTLARTHVQPFTSLGEEQAYILTKRAFWLADRDYQSVMVWYEAITTSVAAREAVEQNRVQDQRRQRAESDARLAAWEAENQAVAAAAVAQLQAQRTAEAERTTNAEPFRESQRAQFRDTHAADNRDKDDTIARLRAQLEVGDDTSPPDPGVTTLVTHKDNVRVPLPQVYSGDASDDIDAVLFAFENYLSGNGITRARWPIHAMQLLKGKALDAYIAFAQPLQKQGGSPTWEDFVSVMHASFITHDRQLEARNSLFNTAQTGTVSAYLQHIRVLISRAGSPPPCDKDLLLMYWKGLQQNVKDDSKVDPTTGAFWTSFEDLAKHTLTISRPHDFTSNRGGHGGGGRKTGGQWGRRGQSSLRDQLAAVKLKLKSAIAKPTHAAKKAQRGGGGGGRGRGGRGPGNDRPQQYKCPQCGGGGGFHKPPCAGTSNGNA